MSSGGGGGNNTTNITTDPWAPATGWFKSNHIRSWNSLWTRPSICCT
jgi:hypothetical protein